MTEAVHFNIALGSIVVIFILVFVITLAFVARRHGQPGGVLFRIALVSVILLLLAGLFFSRVSHRPSVVESQVHDIAAQQVLPEAPIWQEGIEQELQADIYPSAAAAARALGRDLADQLPTIIPDKQSPTSVQIFGDLRPGELEGQVLYALRDGLQEQLPQTHYLIETVRPQAPLVRTDPQAVFITVRHIIHHIDNVTLQPGRGPFILMSRTGAIALDAVGHSSKDQISRSLQFTEKPWVGQFAAFSSRWAQYPFLVARSQGSCTDANIAHRQAAEDACRQINSMIFPDGLDRPYDTRTEGSITPEVLERHGLIVDRFTQSLQGSVGRTWREALLLHPSAEKLNRLRSEVMGTQHSLRTNWAKMIGIFTAMLLVVLGLYAFLNFATKGYYAWSLRIATAALALAGIYVIWLLNA